MNKKGTSLIAKWLLGIILVLNLIGGINLIFIMISGQGLLTQIFPSLAVMIKPIYGIFGLSAIITSVILAIKVFRE